MLVLISPLGEREKIEEKKKTAQRGWARLILDRFHDLVLLPDNPPATTHESDSVSYEHHTYFFPDCGRGAANTAGFGWRGDSGV